MRINGKIYFILGLFLLNQSARTQNLLDTVYSENTVSLNIQDVDYNILMEESAEKNGLENIEVSHIHEAREKYLDKPLNVNCANAEQLSELGILSVWQIEALLQYRESYGKILGLHEFIYIQSYDAETIEKLKPFVSFGEKAAIPMNFTNLLRYGKHQLIMRYQRGLEKSKAYTETASDKAYQGNPDKYYLRYTYAYSDRLKLGFVAEKDAGEAFFRAGQKQGFDFYAAYIYLGKWRFVKSLVLGTYTLEFGQGLCLWNGGGFGKTLSPNIMNRSGMGIRPYSSAAEQGFFMGGAATLEWKKTDFTLFYSNTRNDAAIEQSENSDEDVFEYVESITETGYHRTATEIAKKDKLGQELLGGHININFKRIRIGTTVVYTNLDKAFFPKERLDTKFSKLSKSLWNMGFDYNILISKAHFFGELACSQNGGWASLQAFQMNLHTSFSLHVAHRYYTRNYLNYFSSALAAAGSTNNEKGLNIGFLFDVYKNISLQGNIDFYRSEWFSYSVDAPALGRVYQCKMDYKLSSRASLYVLYRYKNKEITLRQEQGLPMVSESDKHVVRFHFKYTTIGNMELQTRMECSFIGNNRGLLLYQDINYAFKQIPLSLHFRYAVFDTDDYSSRIYAYEADVLNAFTVPAYYDEGCKFYVVLKYDVSKNFSLWLRYSTMYFNNKTYIGSGGEEIFGQRKSEIKLQLRCKF